MSGTMIIAKTTAAAFWLVETFTTLRREDDMLAELKYVIDEVYWAIVDARFLHKREGVIRTSQKTGLITMPSITHFKILHRHQGLAIIELIPETSRIVGLSYLCE